MQDAATLSDAQLVDRTDRRHQRICAEQLDQLRDFVHIDRRRIWERDGARDMAGWVSGRYGYSPWESRRWAKASHALEGLSVVSESLRSGELSLPKVLELARFADPETEQKLARWARRVSPRTIRRRADRETRPDPQAAQEAERDRFVRWWFDDHTMWLEGRLPAEQGAAIAKAVQRLADQLPELPDDDLPDDALPGDVADQRRADALVLIASSHSATEQDDDRAAVVVHKRLPDPDDESVWTELDRGVVLDPAVGRRITCDARLQFVLTDRAGNALGIGRTSRNIPVWLERVVRQRDGWECTFPGCGATTFLKSHHIWHWEDGGPTDLANLVTVCHAHHKLVHEFGWRVGLNGDRAEWFRPNGARFDPGPDPPKQVRLGHSEREGKRNTSAA